MNWRRRISRVLEVGADLTRIPGSAHALSWRPRSVAALRIAQGLRRLCGDLDAVIDAGANVGQFARALAETFPGVPIVSIEADPAVCAQFRTNMQDVPHVTLRECALTDRVGPVVLHRNTYSLASSLLPTAQTPQATFGRMGATTAVTVEGTTLDALFANGVPGERTLLKLDLQGAEALALAGGQATLARVKYVMLEVAFLGTYANEPRFDDLYPVLRAHGLRMLAPLDVLHDDSGVIAQADLLFVADTPT